MEKVMKSNKLGPYINELMMLAMETNHSITYDLAIKELKAISNDINDFCYKHETRKEKSKTDKILIQEEIS